MTDLPLEGRQVVVTGAARGIGRALATGVARAGADVACLDVDEAGARSTASEVEEIGRRATALQCDVTVWDEVRSSVDAVIASLGPVHGVVANAGGSQGETCDFLDLDPASWHRMVDRNLTGAFHTGLAYARHLDAHGGGAIVFVTSQLSETVRPGLAHYCSAKGGVRQLVRAMGAELAPRGIRVNAVAPGPTLTPGNEDLFSRPEVRERNERSIPLGRLGEPHEMVGATVLLLSDAASFIVGATMFVDGGYTVV